MSCERAPASFGGDAADPSPDFPVHLPRLAWERARLRTVAAPLSTSLPFAAPANAAKPDYDENGVDLSLVRYSLSLTPTQRLKAVENFMNAMASVRAVPLSADSKK